MDEAGLSELKKESHAFHVHWGEVTGTFREIELKLRDDLLRFTEKILQTIGIFAGFGFTGIQSVKVIPAFILGEILLIAAILFGIFKLKNIHSTSLDGVQKNADKKNSAFLLKSKIYQWAIAEARDTRKLNVTKMHDELSRADQNLMSELEEKVSDC